VGSDFVFHMPDQDIRGPEEAKQLATAMRTAFPDLQIVHEDVVAAGNKVAVHVALVGDGVERALCYESNEASRQRRTTARCMTKPEVV
jgi:hypothetical protein